MNQAWSAITIILGIIMFMFTHDGILAGELVVGRGSSTTVTLADPHFWFYAASQIGFSLLMVVSGVIYLFTEYEYLPEIDRSNTALYVAYSLVCVVLVTLFAFVFQYILPLFY